MGAECTPRWSAAKSAQSEMIGTPTSELIDRLKEADDAPLDSNGNVKTEKLVSFFRTWAPVAWGDLVTDPNLPEEAAAGEMVESAAEEFRRQLSASLLTIVAMGYTHHGEDGAIHTEVERRPLIQFADLWAKGSWEDMHGYRIWSMKAGTPPVLRVAIRPELFGQLHFRDLASLSYQEFREHIETYNLGRPIRVRGGGVRAVELEPGYLADLLDLGEPTDGQTDSGCQSQTDSEAQNDSPMTGPCHEEPQ